MITVDACFELIDTIKLICKEGYDFSMRAHKNNGNIGIHIENKENGREVDIAQYMSPISTHECIPIGLDVEFSFPDDREEVYLEGNDVEELFEVIKRHLAGEEIF